MKINRLYVILLYLMFNFILSAENITLDFEFTDPDIITHETAITLEFTDTHQFGETGDPALPYLGLSVLLPSGETAREVIVERSERVFLGSYSLLPIQPQFPLCKLPVNQIITKNSDIYSSIQSFPEDPAKGLTTQFYSGFSIGFTAVTPVEYIPATGELYYYRNMIVTFNTVKSDDALLAIRYLHDDPEIVNFVSGNVVNPDMITRYQLPQDRDEPVDYLIICSSAHWDDWTGLADVYLARGFQTEMMSVEEISTTYDGIDLQEKIRNYLKFKFENNVIRYVLLAGDVDVIPHRGLYGIVNEASPDPTEDFDIPADMYYSCLDRGYALGDGPDWNNNNNNKWGEPEEADLIPEFAIGRLCYNNSAEISNMIHKINYYLNYPVAEDLEKVLFLGEDLGWAAWGGDYMDEMIGGSSAHGHETVGVPLEWDITTLYDRNYYWSPNDLFQELSAGPNLVNHLGHSSTTYTMKLTNSDVTNYNIQNNGIDANYFVVFTQGCYGGAFDNRSSNGNYGDDCITEKFLSIANASVSMISNSRYGWGSSINTNGASQFYHREFIDAFFGEDFYRLGLALNDAKVDAIPFMSNVMYWSNYELNLIGDPALSVWTAIPQTMTIGHPEQILLGTQLITVTSSETDADIIVMSGNQVLGSGNSGLSGETTINFSEPVQELGELTIRVIKHNFLTYEGSILVIPTNAPYLTCSEASYQEEGDYLDGSIQSLDEVHCDIILENLGLAGSGSEISLVLSSDSDDLNIIDGTELLTGLGPESELEIPDAFSFELLPGIPDGTELSLTVTISSGDDQWTSTLILPVQGPVIEFAGFNLANLSGDDQILDPGETADIYLTYDNTGSGYSYNLITTLYSYDPYISINGFDLIPQVDPGGQATNLNPFQIEISSDCPEEYYLPVEMLVIDDTGAAMMADFMLPIGVSGFTFENGDSSWEHYSLTVGFLDEWNLNNYRNHTPSGEYSMKCGGSGSAQYSNNVHAGLVSPPIILSGNEYIKFYHWMDAEIQNASTAWDGGLIEISLDGSDFVQIVPVNGYPYTIVSNPDSPFAPGTPVFSGNINWEQVELDLSGYSGTVRLRFVFGTDAAVTQEGWYIDDVEIGSYQSGFDDNNLIPENTHLMQNYPNPFNPLTRINFSLSVQSKVKIEIFNVKGQLVNTLINTELSAGDHDYYWHGINDSGDQVASGIYLYRMSTSGYRATRKMILLR